MPRRRVEPRPIERGIWRVTEVRCEMFRVCLTCCYHGDLTELHVRDDQPELLVIVIQPWAGSLTALSGGTVRILSKCVTRE